MHWSSRSDEARGYPTPLERSPDLLLAAIWFALLTSFAELIILAFKRFALGWALLMPPEVVWMGSVANLVIFTVMGLAFGAGVAIWSRSRVGIARAAVAVFAFASFFGILLSVPGLHKLASLLLAAGLAAQAARLTSPRSFGFLRLCRRTIPWMLTLVVALGVGETAWSFMARRAALARLGTAPNGAPNVLLIILDTVRATSLSLYGYERPTTPGLRRLAARGVVFDRALSPSPWTLPAHASIFTGRQPHELSADWETPLDDNHATLAEILSDRGYVTAGFVANLYYGTYERGLARGFAIYRDYAISVGQVGLSAALARAITNNGTFRQLISYDDILNRKSAEDVNREFLGWLSTHGDRPFFAFLNYYDAHEPFIPPAPFDTAFGPRPEGRRFRHRTNEAFRADKWELTPQAMEEERAAYEGAIAYVDHQLQLLLGELDSRGVLENTLVVVTSDHGEHLGEHGLVDHGNSLYMPLLHVPLLLAFPGKVPEGVRIAEAVTLRDLAATVLDLVDADTVAWLPGLSLARHWRPDSLAQSDAESDLLSVVTGGFGRKIEPIHRGDLKSIVEGHYHYILNGDGREELYDYESDPFEAYDLVQAEDMGTVLQRLRESLGLAIGRPGSRVVIR